MIRDSMAKNTKGGARGSSAPVIKRAPAYFFSKQAALFAEPECIGFGTPDFHVALIEREQANAIILENHYSGKIYSGSRIHLGVMIQGALLGVLQFGVAMNPASADSVVEGTGLREYLELNRMWLSDAAARNSESRALSCAVKFIRRADRRVKWIQSFSDERCGLFGTVYQAAGFTYHGEHTTAFWELDGEFFHPLMLNDTTRADQPGAKRLRENLHRARKLPFRQFRYLKFMAPRFARLCRYPALPYPKPDYAARQLDAPAPAGESTEHSRGAAPIISSAGD